MTATLMTGCFILPMNLIRDGHLLVPSVRTLAVHSGLGILHFLRGALLRTIGPSNFGPRGRRRRNGVINSR
jgi:hypothetical protein